VSDEVHDILALATSEAHHLGHERGVGEMGWEVHLHVL
jgi:hypothetical protein